MSDKLTLRTAQETVVLKSKRFSRVIKVSESAFTDMLGVFEGRILRAASTMGVE